MKVLVGALFLLGCIAVIASAKKGSGEETVTHKARLVSVANPNISALLAAAALVLILQDVIGRCPQQLLEGSMIHA